MSVNGVSREICTASFCPYLKHFCPFKCYEIIKVNPFKPYNLGFKNIIYISAMCDN